MGRKMSQGTEGLIVLIKLSKGNNYLLRTFAMKGIRSVTDCPEYASIPYPIKLVKMYLSLWKVAEIIHQEQ